MLALPKRGIAVSRTQHNGNLEIYADWVEASVLFIDEELSRSEIVDVLMENNVYRRQDFANEWLETVLLEIERRIRLTDQQAPIVRTGNRLRRVHQWTDRPAYAFCLLLAIARLYRDDHSHPPHQSVGGSTGGAPTQRRRTASASKSIASGAGAREYTIQGDLFERLSLEALEAMHWRVTQVGWASRTRMSLAAAALGVASALDESAFPNAPKKWCSPDSKDEGLDLLAWVRYPDGRGGRPVCLVQCASGANWADKLTEPSLATWEKLVDFTTRPRRGLTMPFAPDDDVFRRRANTDDLMLLMDRLRLLGAAPPTKFPSPSLSADLVKWSSKALADLPLISR